MADKNNKPKKSKRYFDADDSEAVPKSKKKKHAKQEETNAGEVTISDLSNKEFKRDDLKEETAKFKKRMRNRVKHRKNREKNKMLQREVDPFPGDAPIPMEKIKKYKRGHKMEVESVKTKFHRASHKATEKKIKEASRQSARAEMLMPEEAGFIEADEGEHTSQITQHDIAGAVDVASAHKFFELNLPQFGPYSMNYTRNGRFLLMGGGKGHIAAFDWQTKKLMCEINVMETVQDVSWLHIETMFAVAQKQWTYVYDNQGLELHCLKALDSVLRLEFLPYHFLLVSANAKGYLSWLDVSVGQKVAGFPTGLGRLDVMCQNPHNAIIHLGHTGGTVTLWSPNVREPLVKMLCHGAGTRSIAVDRSGNYMATSGIDRTLKIWDLRTYKALQTYRIGAGASNLAFSQRGLLAASKGNVVEVYRDCIQKPVSEVYLSHRMPSTVRSLQFCPYEDVLGVGHGSGFQSLLIPGAGEPNFDALEANPYQSKKQRQQAEVKMLLEKVQPDMIALDTAALGRIDTKTLQERLEEKKNLMYLKPQDVDFAPRYKKKGRSKAGNIEKRKQQVRHEKRTQQVKDFQIKQLEKGIDQSGEPTTAARYDIFDRFKKGKE